MNGQYTDKLKVCMYKVLVFQLLIANYFEITFKVTWTVSCCHHFASVVHHKFSHLNILL